MITGVSYAQRYWEDVEAGSVLPRVEDEITYRRVIMNPATTWDYFPGHHDPEYARSQGQPTIYINTMHFLGFVDRLATESLYVSGAPGSGKSTFCRWVTWLACEGRLPARQVVYPPDDYTETFPTGFEHRLPLFVRLREFWQELPSRPSSRQLAASTGSPQPGRCTHHPARHLIDVST